MDLKGEKETETVSLPDDSQQHLSWCRLHFFAVKSIFRERLSACCSATVLSREKRLWMLCAGKRWLGPAHSEARGEKRELGESDARYETLNCPLFHPTIGMEMAHACQGGLGGMTSKETDVIGYEVRSAERRWPACFYCREAENSLSVTWMNQGEGRAVSAAVRSELLKLLQVLILQHSHTSRRTIRDNLKYHLLRYLSHPAVYF